MKNFKPILFSAPMVQAILEGRKTQTRRVIKPQPVVRNNGCFTYIKNKKNGFYGPVDTISDDFLGITGMAKYKKGNILWVRETWQQHCQVGCNKDGVCYEATEDYVYRADGTELPKNSKAFGKWKPSIFMPKAACRIFLEVTNVRVERLQDISEEDAKAEGAFDNNSGVNGITQFKSGFQDIWYDVNGSESWDSNPWVWVYDFKKVEKPANFG